MSLLKIENAFLTAVDKGKHQDVLVYLKQIPDINVRNRGWSALIRAVDNSDAQMTRILLEHGANPNDKFASDTVLILASFYGDVENVKLLLKYGADLSLRNRTGETALICARKQGHQAIIHILEKEQKRRDHEEKVQNLHQSLSKTFNRIRKIQATQRQRPSPPLKRRPKRK